MPEHLSVVSTGAPDLPHTSESEEMYLITVARAVESGQPEPIPMAAISESMQVSVASVNEMVRKLAARGLLTYEPYHGAGLTESGWAIANRVLRTRRMWATFLVDRLGFSPQEADEQACQLEHVTVADAVDRLSTYLDDPTTDPLGSPIPQRGVIGIEHPVTIGLDRLVVDRTAEIVAITAPRAIRDFLEGEGIGVGTTISVIAAGESGVLVDAGSPTHLTRHIASMIGVRPSNPDPTT